MKPLPQPPLQQHNTQDERHAIAELYRVLDREVREAQRALRWGAAARRDRGTGREKQLPRRGLIRSSTTNLNLTYMQVLFNWDTIIQSFIWLWNIIIAAEYHM